MPQLPDFSNQDLRNRSFRGQDLAGANFRKADIRGCDFSNANLEGADFSGVTAGQSHKQAFTPIAIATAFAFVGVGRGGFVGVFAGTFVAMAIAVAPYTSDTDVESLLKIGLSLPICSAFLALISVIAGAEIAEGNIINGISIFLSLLLMIFFLYVILRQAYEQDAIGTFFKKAELTNSKFANAALKSCNFMEAELTNSKFANAALKSCNFMEAELTTSNFVGATVESCNFEEAELTNSNFADATVESCSFVETKTNQTDWTHAHFMRCKFSGYLDNQAIRELCVSRIGANENFSSMDLSGLNLIGVNLCGANLSAANISQTNLSQADLSNANLCNVQAIKTNFTNADLSGACIENWAITPETNFIDVVCSHIFLDSARTERQPASGFLEQDDFAKLITQSTKSLDFFFRNGIDPQAFDFALNNLMDNYREMGISLKSVEDLGDGDRIVRFNTVPDAPKGEMHAQFTQDYEEMRQQLEASRNKVYELQQKLDRIDLENKLERFELEKQLAVAIAKLEERPTSEYLQNLVYHQTTQLGQQKLLYAPHSQFGDTMTDKSIQSGGDVFFTGRDNTGVSGKDQQGVAGREISGTVTNTLQQLRETNQPEAPKLSDLLEQLQKAVETSSELGEPEKQKALEYLNQIGELSAQEPAKNKGMLTILLDAFTGVISKAASLIDPVKKIAAAIVSIWQAHP
ncbi:MAG: pentapeptide repeat-containing protein [Pseudanabaenaceae cyanobacterium bins.39]|nr:pentapeptide repeat-containing protein [Pseudanabaenaceae cyanobacterium bins.39]